jgi:hypothetical protein
MQTLSLSWGVCQGGRISIVANPDLELGITRAKSTGASEPSWNPNILVSVLSRCDQLFGDIDTAAYARSTVRRALRSWGMS